MENATESIPVLVQNQKSHKNAVLYTIAVIVVAGAFAVLGYIAASASNQATQAQHGQQVTQQQNSQLQGQLKTMGNQLKAVEAQLKAPQTAAQPAIIAHLGVCVNQYPDSTTGDLLSISITAPTDSNGVFSCTSGSFVPVAPTGSGG